MKRPHDLDAPQEETCRMSLSLFLRARYWGRWLFLAATLTIVLGLVDAFVKILTWQLALVAACVVTLGAVATRNQMRWTLLLLSPATGIQFAQMLDQPDTPRFMIFVFTASLFGFALHVNYSRRFRLADRPPDRVVLELTDGRQIPMRLLLTGGPGGTQRWIAVSGNGKFYLPDGVEHHLCWRGPQEVTLGVQHEEDGRTYVPDIHTLAGEI